MHVNGGIDGVGCFLRPRNQETCFHAAGKTSLTGARIRSSIERADYFVDSK
jgi:hypothetical protein